MEELLEEIDRDYYRAARLLIVHAEIENLRRGSSVAAGAARPSGMARGRSFSTDGDSPQVLQAAPIRVAQPVSPAVDTSR
jgi:hypothetical protein